MERVNANDLEWREGASGPKYLFRGPKLDWGVIRLLPGQTLGAHYHQRVEETFFFTSGAPLMMVNGVSHRVRIGDAFAWLCALVALGGAAAGLIRGLRGKPAPTSRQT